MIPTRLTSKLLFRDTKGFAARYDFFSGTDVYDLTDQIHENGEYSIILKNSANDERTFCLQGTGLLIIYEYQDSPVIEYWVNEGCDMIYAEHGITPEMATTTTYFKGDIDAEKVSRASEQGIPDNCFSIRGPDPVRNTG